MESKSFPSNSDIAGRYAKHRKQHYLRYGERGNYSCQNRMKMKQQFIITILLISVLSLNAQNKKDSVNFDVLEADSLYNGKILAEMWYNHSFDTLNLGCNNSEAIRVYVKRLKMIMDYINQNKATYIDYLICNFELLTNIESDADASYAGKINPTINDIRKWTEWLKKNKKYLCYYNKHNIVFLRLK